MSEWTSVTFWYRDDKYNHVEDGYDRNRTSPTPMFDSQKKAWANGNWKGVQGAFLIQDGLNINTMEVIKNAD